MSNAAPADGRRMAETACGLGSEGPTSAVTRGSAAGAQPSHQNNCSDCGKGRWAPANDFHSKDPLATNERQRAEFDAIDGSARLLMAIQRYVDNHQPGAIA